MVFVTEGCLLEDALTMFAVEAKPIMAEWMRHRYFRPKSDRRRGRKNRKASTIKERRKK